MNVNERFIKSIESACKDIGLHSKILPSILASQAILMSNYGLDVHTMFSRNLYHLMVDDKWNGMCYSKDEQKTYANKDLARDQSSVTAPILYRVYNDYYESIEEIPVTLYDDNYKFWTSYEYNPKKSLLNIEFSIIGYKNARLLFSIALLKHRRELEPIYWENK